MAPTPVPEEITITVEFGTWKRYGLFGSFFQWVVMPKRGMVYNTEITVPTSSTPEEVANLAWEDQGRQKRESGAPEDPEDAKQLFKKPPGTSFKMSKVNCLILKKPEAHGWLRSRSTPVEKVTRVFTETTKESIWALNVRNGMSLQVSWATEEDLDDLGKTI